MTKDLLIYFARAWQKRYGKAYAIAWAKDSTQVKRLLKFHTPEDLRRYFDWYLSGFTSDFSKRAGHSFGAFLGELPAVVASAETQVKRATVPQETLSDWDRLEGARKCLK